MDLVVLVQSIVEFILSVVNSLLLTIQFIFVYLSFSSTIFSYLPPILTSFFMVSLTLVVVKLLGGR